MKHVDPELISIPCHIATTGEIFPEDAPITATTHDVGNNRLTTTKTWDGVSYRETRTYSGNNLATTSGWVKL